MTNNKELFLKWTKNLYNVHLVLLVCGVLAARLLFDANILTALVLILVTGFDLILDIERKEVVL